MDTSSAIPLCKCDCIFYVLVKFDFQTVRNCGMSAANGSLCTGIVSLNKNSCSL